MHQTVRAMNAARDGGDAATVRDRYDVRVVPAPRWAVPRAAAAFVVAAMSQGITSTYGARRVTVTDRTTGEVVGRFREGLLVDERTRVGIMLTEIETLSADEFETRWLRNIDNRLNQG